MYEVYFNNDWIYYRETVQEERVVMMSYIIHIINGSLYAFLGRYKLVIFVFITSLESVKVLKDFFGLFLLSDISVKGTL